jgi:anti-sigma regulatory factor (Ser/Thr protein kinase)
MAQRRVELVVPAAAEEVPRVRLAVVTLAERCGYAGRLEDIRLTVTEACANVVAHAYPDSTNGSMEVSATAGRTTFVVRVHDRGGGMVPWSQSNGLGLGMALMNTLADRVEVESRIGHGVQLCLCFELQSSRLAAAAAIAASDSLRPT